MSSRKLQALDFIKRYFLQWGHSPTLGELAAELDVSNKRAHDLVHQLAEDQMIDVLTGKTRGIRLRERGAELSEADILLRLSAMGWTIGQGSRVIPPPSNPDDAAIGAAIIQGLMEKGLHGLPMLDHQAGLNDPAPPSATTGRCAQAGSKPGAGTSGKSDKDQS